MSSQRLNKYIALHTGTSRREADEYIASGRISINGHKATLGSQVSSDDHITFDGNLLSHSTAHLYLLFHKPVGYVCSRRQQGDIPTIYSLLPEKYHHLKPVGRLDKDSSGLIVLTNDGDFAHQMTHPSFHKIKIYEVTLDRALQPLHQQMISDHGVQLEDGVSQFHIESLDKKHGYKITMHEGRNRQIRRTFGSLGYTVTRLHRTQFGNYTLDLDQGKYKEITIA